MKRIILATVAPLLLIISLFLLTSKSKIKTFAFQRKNISLKWQIVQTVSNTGGIYAMREFNNKLYGTDYRSVYAIEFPSMRPTKLTDAVTQPLIGWGFCGDKLFSGIANTNSIYYADSSGKLLPYQETPYRIRKIFIANDSMIVFTALDTLLTNDDFYTFTNGSRHAYDTD